MLGQYIASAIGQTCPSAQTRDIHQSHDEPSEQHAHRTDIHHTHRIGQQTRPIQCTERSDNRSSHNGFDELSSSDQFGFDRRDKRRNRNRSSRVDGDMQSRNHCWKRDCRKQIDATCAERNAPLEQPTVQTEQHAAAQANFDDI